ncbi:hypothetical protein [Geotalea sp. SG265]|uniref:hypothetical protein n=1 Tax=Geotalea sp. SG265 TaxID=2922867 RepID=UPI001FAEC70C|nr:hypothetical protein [Geotalea sp. SG265]
MKHVANFLGKTIYVYDPQINCTEADLSSFLVQFNRLETLRIICDMSSQLFHGRRNSLTLGNVPVREDVLCDLAYRVLRECNEDNNLEMTAEQLELALRMCHRLNDSASTREHQNAFEILLYIAYRQFAFQEKNFNNFARNYYLYAELWQRVARCQHIDILSEIESEIGIPYDFAILFAYAICGNKNGHFWIYDEKAIDELNCKTGLRLTVAYHEKFVKWCSADYDTILSINSKLPPFIRHPIIATHSEPVQNKGEVFLVVSKQYLHDKLPSGLYFHLIDRFNKGGSNNKFKECFGYVFEEYIGQLLRFYFKNWEVIREIRYKKGKHFFQDSADWFVLKNDKLIIIEVKQSSIFSQSKHNPSIENVRSDLITTILHATKQLRTSHSDIESGKFPELERLSSAKSFVKLIVVNDPFYTSNFIVQCALEDNTVDKDVQIININDFEIMLSNQKDTESLFDILYYKSINEKEMDFNEFIIKMFPHASTTVEFLAPIYDEFFNKLKIEDQDERQQSGAAVNPHTLNPLGK